MKRFALTRMVLGGLGLVGLSAAGGALLVASHTALSAGPRLPEHVIRAHAIAAAQSQTTPVALREGSLWPASIWPEKRRDRAEIKEYYEQVPAPAAPASVTTAQPAQAQAPAPAMFVSSQSSDTGLAPFRALRPQARPLAYERVAQASAATVPTRQTARQVTRQQQVSSNRQVLRDHFTLEPEPLARSQRPGLLGRLTRSDTPRRAARDNGAMRAGYLHGVFR